MERLNYIDNIRGIAFMLMLVQHINFFYRLRIQSMDKNVLVEKIGILSRTLFIVLAGYCLYQSSVTTVVQKDKYITFIKKRSKKSLFIGVFALFISVVSYFLYPDKFIRFGILHFIALGTFLVSFVAPSKILTFLVFLLALVIKVPSINPLLDTITGSKAWFSMMDWFPLQKWLGVLLFGVMIGQYTDPTMFQSIPYLQSNNALTMIGRNSLEFYTGHIVLFMFLSKM